MGAGLDAASSQIFVNVLAFRKILKTSSGGLAGNLYSLVPPDRLRIAGGRKAKSSLQPGRLSTTIDPKAWSFRRRRGLGYAR